MIKKVVTSEVQFKLISRGEMDAYLLKNEYQDKAGGYAIQGISSFWITSINGSYTNVMGLPLTQVATDLQLLHPDWLPFPWRENVNL